MRKNQVSPAEASAGAAISDLLPLAHPNTVQRILVVDDDPFLCHRNAEVLIRHGYEVNATEDAKAGWEELQTNRYHLLITENELPVLTGLELVKKMRSARMALPVIMASEKALLAQAVRQLRLHPVVTLLKPYTISEFLEAVEVVLGATNIGNEKAVPPSWQSYLPADDLSL